MEIKDFNQALEIQKELSAKLLANVDKLRKANDSSVPATVDELKRLISQAKVELEASEMEKERAIKQWDLRLQQRKASVERLTKDLKELEKKIAEQEKVTRRPVPRPN